MTVNLMFVISIRKLSFYVALAFLFLATASAKESVKYAVPIASKDFRPDFPVELIKHIFSQSKTYQPYPVFMNTSLESSEHLLARQDVDILWTGADDRLAEKFKMIRYPLNKGLLGYRIMLVREDFKYPKDVLSSLIFTQGEPWPDTKIFRYNKLNVVTANTYEGLFSILINGKVDAFPRAITEVWREKEILDTDRVKVEESLVLHYPFALFFYVHMHRKDLAQQIESSMKVLFQSGELDSLIIKYYGRDIAKSKLNNRRVLELENPYFEIKPEEKYLFDIDALVTEAEQLFSREQPQ